MTVSKNIRILKVLASALLLAFAANQVSAQIPTQGIMVEGVLVPGLELGDTRDMATASYGSPGNCGGIADSSCTYVVSGTGSLVVHYESAAGGAATGAGSDRVSMVTVYGFDEWETLAGVSNALATADQQAVIDAYPGAEVTHYTTISSVRSVTDDSLGVSIDWLLLTNGGGLTILPTISIYEGDVAGPPPPPAPEPEMVLNVDSIQLFKAGRNVNATVFIKDEFGIGKSGVSVKIRWKSPKGKAKTITRTTNSSGIASFSKKASRGTHTVTVLSVSKSGYEYDAGSSVTSRSIVISR